MREGTRRRRKAEFNRPEIQNFQTASHTGRFKHFLDSAIPITAVLSTLITAIALIISVLAYEGQVSANVEQQRALVLQDRANLMQQRVIQGGLFRADPVELQGNNG
jgi:hypothetical protein